MADVARVAGVSLATVSRALRGLPGVGAATRERVLAVAEELAYVVSPAASSLSSKETGRVAVVMPRVDVWFYATTLSVLERELRAGGVDVLVYQVDGPSERGRFVEQLPSRRKVDAVVLAALPLSSDQQSRLGLLGVPTVIAGGRVLDLPHVETDDLAMAHAAVGHLADLGHRRIAMVRTSDTDDTSWDADVLRVRGYRDELASRGLPVEDGLLVTEDYSPHAGALALRRLLALPDPPTAVFAYSDELAVSVALEAQRQGLAVPGDLSVMGVDGHPLNDVFGLSTVDQDVATQAREAAAMTLRLMRGEPGPTAVVVPHRLVPRASTSAP